MTRGFSIVRDVLTPILVGVSYYVFIVPTGLVMGLVGKDPLRLKRDARAVSYWIVRTPPGPADQSMNEQS